MTDTTPALALTANGALSHATASSNAIENALTELIYRSVRGATAWQFKAGLDALVGAGRMADLAVMAFYVRDVRGGKGERQLGRELIHETVKRMTECQPDTLSKVLRLVPEYGRWDDLVWLYNASADVSDASADAVREHVLSIVADQLTSDQAMLNAYLSTFPEIEQTPSVSMSLCSKWVPSERSAMDCGRFFRALCKRLKFAPKELRQMLSAMRAFLNIVETKLTSGTLSDVSYSAVPSQAMQRYKKAFRLRDTERFGKWTEDVAAGKTKVNVGTLTPPQLAMEMINRFTGYENGSVEKSLIESQWDAMIRKARQLNLPNMLVMADVSGSMAINKCLPMSVSIGLGMFISELTTGTFHDRIMTFSKDPALVELSGGVTERFRQVRNTPWGMNTDLQAAFGLVLEEYRKNRDAGKDVAPIQTLIIISDMQFDQAVLGGAQVTNFEAIKARFREQEFEMPSVIFWNVANGSGEVPVKMHETGTMLFSGFTPALLRFITEGKTISTQSVISDVLNDERYAKVRAAFAAAAVGAPIAAIPVTPTFVASSTETALPDEIEIGYVQVDDARDI